MKKLIAINNLRSTEEDLNKALRVKLLEAASSKEKVNDIAEFAKILVTDDNGQFYETEISNVKKIDILKQIKAGFTWTHIIVKFVHDKIYRRITVNNIEAVYSSVYGDDLDAVI